MLPPLHILMPVPEAGDPDWLRLPARPGVVLFETQTGGVAMVGAAGDARAFVRARLAPTGRCGADLRPITARVRGTTVGSSFEADLTWLALARRHLPRTYRAATDRWRGWWVHLDADAALPVWRKTDLTDLIDTPPSGVLLGPISDKDAAGRFGELLDDLFDLCRYPRELAKAPHGQACVYKEMGKCPAACDGSEPMDDYRTRARSAARLTHDRQTLAADLDARIAEASARLDFEEARRLQDKRGVLDRALARKAYARATTLDRLAVLAVLPSERTGWARLIAWVSGAWIVLADAHAGLPRAAAAELLGRVRAAGGHAGGFGFTRAEVERVGLLCRELFRPSRRGRRRRSTMLDLHHATPAQLVRAVGSAAAASDADEDQPEAIAIEGVQ